MVSWGAEGLSKATLVDSELEICKVVSIHVGILYHLSFLF